MAIGSRVLLDHVQVDPPQRAVLTGAGFIETAPGRGLTRPSNTCLIAGHVFSRASTPDRCRTSLSSESVDGGTDCSASCCGVSPPHLRNKRSSLEVEAVKARPARRSGCSAARPAQAWATFLCTAFRTERPILPRVEMARPSRSVCDRRALYAPWMGMAFVGSGFLLLGLVTGAGNALFLPVFLAAVGLGLMLMGPLRHAGSLDNTPNL